MKMTRVQAKAGFQGQAHFRPDPRRERKKTYVLLGLVCLSVTHVGGGKTVRFNKIGESRSFLRRAWRKQREKWMRGRKKDGGERVSGAPFRFRCVNNLRSGLLTCDRPRFLAGVWLRPRQAAALGRGGLASPG